MVSVHPGRVYTERELLSGAGGGLGTFRRDVPRQEFVDAVDRMIGDAGQHIAEIGFGVEVVEFGAADQAVDRGGSFAASIGAGEQVVFPGQSDHA